MPPKKSPAKSTKAPKDRHPITANLDEKEYRRVQADLTVMLKRTGLEVKPSTYCKHALLQYAKHRAVIDLLEGMIRDAAAAHGDMLSIESIKTALSAGQA